MALATQDESYTVTAAVDRFKAVKAGSTKSSCTPVGATSDLVLGIIQETVAAADVDRRVVAVRTHGISMAVAGASISTPGTELKVTAAGKFIPVASAGDIIAGRARTTAAADGDWFEIDLYASNKHA
jgi:hypothetical protein